MILQTLPLNLDSPGTPLQALPAQIARAASPVWVQSNALPLRLVFYSAGLPVQLSGGAAVSAHGKRRIGYRVQSALLIQATEFAYASRDSVPGYEAILNLRTTPLEALFTAASTPVEMQLDIEITDNDSLLTCIVPIVIVPRAADPDAPPPSPVGPDTHIRIRDGELQLWNPDTETWVLLTVRGEQNQIQRDNLDD